MYTNKQIWSVSYPILLSLLAQNVINVTDTAFLGHVSEVALGASAMGGLFYICIFTIAFGFSTGSQIVIARRNGEGRYSDVGPVMIQGIMFLLLIAILMFGFTKAFGEISCGCWFLPNPSTKALWSFWTGVFTGSSSRLSMSCSVPCTSVSHVQRY